MPITWRDIVLRAYPNAAQRDAAIPPGAATAPLGPGIVAVNIEGGASLTGHGEDAVVATGGFLALDSAGGDAPILTFAAGTSIKACWWIPVNRIASQRAFLLINPIIKETRVWLELKAWPGERDDIQIRVFAAYD